MGCTVSQEDDRNIVSEDESSSHSLGMKPRKLSERIYEARDCDSITKRKKKSFFSRFSAGTSLASSTEKRESVTCEVTDKEIESWSDSNKGFENLMASPAGRQIFEQYLKGEFSAENLIFWNACNDLKSVKSKEIFKQKVERIFINHLDSSSPYEVSLDAKVKEKLMSVRGNPTENIFDEAQCKIYSLMHRDSFSRFLVSNCYEKLLNKRNKCTLSIPDESGFETSDSPRNDEVGVEDQSQSQSQSQSQRSEAPVLRSLSVGQQKAIANLETKTLDYETEKLLLFSK